MEMIENKEEITHDLIPKDKALLKILVKMHTYAYISMNEQIIT
jgi:hypothetical protein